MVYLCSAHGPTALCKHHQCLNPAVLIGHLIEKFLPGPHPQPIELVVVRGAWKVWTGEAGEDVT